MYQCTSFDAVVHLKHPFPLSIALSMLLISSVHCSLNVIEKVVGIRGSAWLVMHLQVVGNLWMPVGVNEEGVSGTHP